MTKQRQIILDIINSSCEHLTAEQVFLKAKGQLNKIAFATIYNNLNYLVNEKIIRRIEIPNSPDHYDRNMNPHEHLICTKCGEVVDCNLPGLKEMFEEKLSHSISGYSLSLFYECEKCKN